MSVSKTVYDGKRLLLAHEPLIKKVEYRPHEAVARRMSPNRTETRLFLKERGADRRLEASYFHLYQLSEWIDSEILGPDYREHLEHMKGGHADMNKAALAFQKLNELVGILKEGEWDPERGIATDIIKRNKGGEKEFVPITPEEAQKPTAVDTIDELFQKRLSERTTDINAVMDRVGVALNGTDYIRAKGEIIHLVGQALRADRIKENEKQLICYVKAFSKIVKDEVAFSNELKKQNSGNGLRWRFKNSISRGIKSLRHGRDLEAQLFDDITNNLPSQREFINAIADTAANIYLLRSLMPVLGALESKNYNSGMMSLTMARKAFNDGSKIKTDVSRVISEESCDYRDALAGERAKAVKLNAARTAFRDAGIQSPPAYKDFLVADYIQAKFHVPRTQLTQKGSEWLSSSKGAGAFIGRLSEYFHNYIDHGGMVGRHARRHINESLVIASSVVTTQKAASMTNMDYAHMHLWKKINGIWYDDIFAGSNSKWRGRVADKFGVSAQTGLIPERLRIMVKDAARKAKDYDQLNSIHMFEEILIASLLQDEISLSKTEKMALWGVVTHVSVGKDTVETIFSQKKARRPVEEKDLEILNGIIDKLRAAIVERSNGQDSTLGILPPESPLAFVETNNDAIRSRRQEESARPSLRGVQLRKDYPGVY
ncbi:MAG: hypothetical protein KGH98_02195 [Candidatus Micrarchaeota archaeon]|nr:hypothetical protein [Candidatus Micrarchaeota archaeon]